MDKLQIKLKSPQALDPIQDKAQLCNSVDQVKGKEIIQWVLLKITYNQK